MQQGSLILCAITMTYCLLHLGVDLAPLW